MANQQRGLAKLLSSTFVQQREQSTDTVQIKSDSRILDIPISFVHPNPEQPRKMFDPEMLDLLAQSIRHNGLLQPIVVRPLPDGQYQIIAGERRWRAAQLADLATIRATCREFDDKNALMTSLLENLQRENLDPIEEASGYYKMVTDWKMKHEEIASAVGKDRATVSNTLRLLDLPKTIQAKIIERKLTPGHARALLAITDPNKQQTVSEKIISEGLSVRQTEKIIYGDTDARSDVTTRTQLSKPAHLADLEKRVSERLGVKSLIQQGRRGGKLVIKFSSNAEFMHILDVLGVTD